MRNLLTLPGSDPKDLAEEGKVEIKCEFCDKAYNFDENDLRTIMSYANKR